MCCSTVSPALLPAALFATSSLIKTWRASPRSGLSAAEIFLFKEISILNHTQLTAAAAAQLLRGLKHFKRLNHIKVIYPAFMSTDVF